MTLAPLAIPADLPTAFASSPQAGQALDIASAAIRDAAGAAISRTTATVSLDGSTGTLLRIPGPIVAVDSVTIDGSTVTDFRTTSAGLWRRAGWAGYDGISTVVVRYTYGPVNVPADIVDLCAQLATAWLQHDASGGGSNAGVTQVKIDDASESYTEEAAGQISPVFIPQATRTWLAARFGGSAATVVDFIK